MKDEVNGARKCGRTSCLVKFRSFLLTSNTCGDSAGAGSFEASVVGAGAGDGAAGAAGAAALAAGGSSVAAPPSTAAASAAGFTSFFPPLPLFFGGIVSVDVRSK